MAVITTVPAPVLFDPNWINPFVNPTPVFKAAAAATLAGTSDTVIAMIGDSTTKGSGGSGYNNAYPHVLASLLSGANPPLPSMAEARFGNPDVTDSQLSIGAGWSQSAASAGGNMQQNSTTTNPITLTTPVSITSFDFYYWGGDACSITVKVDGSTVDTISATSDLVLRKSSYSVSSGTHVIDIARASGGNVFFVGLDIRPSTKKLVFNNIGAGGTDSTYWKDNTTYHPLVSISVMQPNLTIINLGINDWRASQTAGTYNSQMQTIINVCKIYGDVILTVPVPADTGIPGCTLAEQQALNSQVYNLAVSNGYIGLDMTKRWGDYVAANANGFESGDGLHPSNAGYADEAGAFVGLLKYCLT
jgi:lysophospholipase L1-like esterase